MGISETADLVEAQIFPQGDVRDPLGTWGVRHGITGDATAEPIRVQIQVPAARRSAFVYTVYSVNIALIAGTPTTSTVKLRLLTNWPNIDPQAGVQAYGGLRIAVWAGSTAFNAPIGGIAEAILDPQDRFILLYDPRPGVSPMVIAELEINLNILGDTYSFEAWGYYWDRSVLQAPGGPRHPGAN